ncbi:fibroblast growth factor receptor substrate 2 [Anoplolepis gracilipes]|uniref:fibroblast growth factor receptor substrate 2 n=1 Tax=Anoplolepis gracilipes TaxID=354296 RepID=UPI003B9F29D2
MGCVNSRTNIFQVMNVNDQGKPIARGRLEITEGSIIFHQNSKQPTTWPLRCLRRYGFDSELFSFESGRRCPTGEGIYAFKCKKARDLFNLVQTKLQVSKNGDDTVSTDFSVMSHPTPAPREPTYLDPIPSNRSNSCMDSRLSHSQQNGIRRLSSVESSSSPISPQGTVESSSPPLMLPPPPPISQPHPSSYVNEEILSSSLTEHNNNKNFGRTVQRSPQIIAVENAIFRNALAETESIPVQPSEMVAEATNCDLTSPLLIKAPYMNLDICSEILCNRISPTPSTSETSQLKEESNLGGSHAYINVHPGQDHVEKIARVRPPPLPVLQSDVEEISKHCYYNVDTSDIQSLKKRISGTSITEKSPLAPSPTECPIRKMNYAELDLDTRDLSAGTDNNVNSPPSSPKSPNKPQEGYVTIDFQKTVALSHVNPNHDNEGSRKTRHNSTIDDLVTAACKHNSSISE